MEECCNAEPRVYDLNTESLLESFRPLDVKNVLHIRELSSRLHANIPVLFPSATLTIMYLHNCHNGVIAGPCVN